ncbi:hypothetical protein DBB42_14360 [Pseudomonas plecoglossicida]|uniref:Uncharacterized protein n=1 Tax=Pseudomonas plecoglossicida TaxID=70775 RepID=A0A2R7UJI0_PSEDL|nr:hypothetical protein DBB42_14360 [Pseudomonas plecoglossicida]RFQ06158.1 hypothetical protein D0O09_01225 [Pseudomonas putida]
MGGGRGCHCWPLRGLARSHRFITGLGNCAEPVGAGEPAKKPAPFPGFLPEISANQRKIPRLRPYVIAPSPPSGRKWPPFS